MSDWPILAVAIAFEVPIWTEDKDFFGCGAATWTTDRVRLYLEEELGIMLDPAGVDPEMRPRPDRNSVL